MTDPNVIWNALAEKHGSPDKTFVQIGREDFMGVLNSLPPSEAEARANCACRFELEPCPACCARRDMAEIFAKHGPLMREALEAAGFYAALPPQDRSGDARGLVERLRKYRGGDTQYRDLMDEAADALEAALALRGTGEQWDGEEGLPFQERVETILIRRLTTKQLEGYTLETAREIAALARKQDRATESYAEWQQKRGWLADTVAWALNEYDAFMADDNFDAQGALDKIIAHLREVRDTTAQDRAPDEAGVVERARELLAAEYESDTRLCGYAAAIRAGTSPYFAPAIRAVVAALPSTPRGVPDRFRCVSCKATYPNEPEACLECKGRTFVEMDQPRSKPSSIRDQALEEAARRIENGSFLHDKAPSAMFAKEAAAAIRALKSTPTPREGDQ